MKRFWCRKCNPKEYMTREDLRKHLRKEHLIKANLSSFLDGKNRKQTQPWWGEEEWD